LYTREIQHILRTLGIGRRFIGYNILSDALLTALTVPDALVCYKSNIMQPLAIRYQCPLVNIERNIRTVITHAWQVNPDYLCHLAGYPLQKAPSSSEFIDILSTSILRHHEYVNRHK